MATLDPFMIAFELLKKTQKNFFREKRENNKSVALASTQQLSPVARNSHRTPHTPATDSQRTHS